ncbi:MAG: hypothetical protein JXR97_08180, partial [Planctomycetes bacterium]|nr:hypothetical protein [Planctomycetota bacterium]
GACIMTWPVMVVVIQSALWLLSQWLLFRVARMRLGGLVLPFVVSFLSITTLGALVMVFLSLSEMLFLALLMIAVFYLDRHDSCGTPSSAWAAIFFMALGAVVRPAGFYPFLLVALYFLILWIKQPARLAVLVACSVPVLAQVGFMIQKFHSPSVSLISYVTLDNYLLSRYDAENKGIGFREARVVRRGGEFAAFQDEANPATASAFTKRARADFFDALEEHPSLLAGVYYRNMVYNAMMGSPFVNIGEERPSAYAFSEWQNRIRSFGGIVLAFLALVAVAVAGARQGFVEVLLKRRFDVLLALFIIYFLAISGITLLQGDRVTLPVCQLFPLMLGTWVRKLAPARVHKDNS